jgi:spore coat polysaccharide biosynthesis predicted glycosyltransferase SpsG
MADRTDELMKLADDAIHAYAAWLAEFTVGELPSLHVDRLNNEKDAARRKLEAAIRSAVDGVGASAGGQP